MPFEKSSINNIIGLPPAAYEESQFSVNKVLASVPVLKISPVTPEYEGTGIKLYYLDFNKGAIAYNKILESCGIAPISTGSSSVDLYVAFINEGPISETWSNEYTESMFEEISGLASRPLKELKALGMSGPSEALGKVVQYIQGLKSKNEGNILSTLLNAGLLGAEGATKLSQLVVGGLENYAGDTGTGNVIKRLLTGSNIDFPMIWGASSFQPNYTILVRLVNRYPNDTDEYQLRIIEPLVKLLALGMPISDSESTYTYPLICKIECPGLFSLEGAYISSIDVTKGNDGMDIGFTQRPGTVDVRITFGDLYNSMISINEKDNIADKSRPTLKKYIDTLRDRVQFPNPYSIPSLPNPKLNYVTSSPLSSEDMIDVDKEHKAVKIGEITPTSPSSKETNRTTRIPTDEEIQAETTLRNANSSSNIEDTSPISTAMQDREEFLKSRQEFSDSFTDEYIRENSRIEVEPFTYNTGETKYFKDYYIIDKNGREVKVAYDSPIAQRIDTLSTISYKSPESNIKTNTKPSENEERDYTD